MIGDVIIDLLEEVQPSMYENNIDKLVLCENSL